MRLIPRIWWTSILSSNLLSCHDNATFRNWPFELMMPFQASKEYQILEVSTICSQRQLLKLPDRFRSLSTTTIQAIWRWRKDWRKVPPKNTSSKRRREYTQNKLPSTLIFWLKKQKNSPQLSKLLLNASSLLWVKGLYTYVIAIYLRCSLMLRNNSGFA